ncbi:MAG: hypothetical protein FWD85_01740 [Microbacteriaceae bacterium]|nr:hypothetical protein [Microbacteriaceae bacterium]MCL2794010.1 hypothetical protein [Microbacteriaceae bacterium]
MTELNDADREVRRAELRARVRALEDECRVLRAGLPGVDRWHGLAGATYRLRVARLRAGVETVLAWLDEGRGAL